jgi:RimJ/RimL family protein N-acetyltransferase
MQVRRASVEDCEELWRWANDPETRTVSYSAAPIPWPDHVTWLHAKLADKNCALYIAQLDCGTPIGQVRFDLLDAATAVVSISLARHYRSKGHGSQVLRMATDTCLAETGVAEIVAFIKTTNERSIRCFTKAGFSDPELVLLNGAESLRLVRRLPKSSDHSHEDSQHL